MEGHERQQRPLAQATQRHRLALIDASLDRSEDRQVESRPHPANGNSHR
jgi:hypothetical protein